MMGLIARCAACVIGIAAAVICVCAVGYVTSWAVASLFGEGIVSTFAGFMAGALCWIFFAFVATGDF